MYDNDYIVLIDENGQPYIAHGWRDSVRSAASAARNAASGVGRGVREKVKYIEKIVDKGKTRYFYTQDELKAFYNNTRNRASNAVNQAKNASRNAINNAKERVGINARQRYNQAIQNVKSYNEAVNGNSQIKQDMALRSREQINNAATVAVNKYMNTPLGKIESFLNGTGEKIKSVAALAAAAGVTAAAIPAAAVSMLAMGAVAAPIIAAKYASYKLNELYNYELSWRINNASRDIENATRGVQNAVNSAKETVTNAANSVKEKASSAINSVKERKEIADTSNWIKKDAKTRGISEEESYNQLVNWLDGMIKNSPDAAHREYYEQQKEYAEKAYH